MPWRGQSNVDGDGDTLWCKLAVTMIDAGYDYDEQVDEPDGHDDGNSTTDDGVLYFHVATAPVANYSI